MRVPLVPVTVAFLLGIVARTLPPFHPAVAIALSLLRVGIVLGWDRRRWSTAALLLVWGMLGILRTQVWLAHPDAQFVARLPEEPRPWPG